jgi:glyoxylase-like metal-dependent hydrolase (beta-lactamase superfamily II)
LIEVGDDVYVVKQGKVIYDKEGIVRYASSTVTLIDDDFAILVDTGLKEDWPVIESGIKEAGFSPSEIDIVVNTHLHLDHVGCNDRFEARKYAHPTEIAQTNARGYTPCPRRISKRISILETPGHTDGHISVVFDREIVIAGDAIPTKNHYARRVIPRIHTDVKKAMESLLEIIKIAKIIIPGHDKPLEVVS